MSTKPVVAWLARLNAMLLPMGADQVAAVREKCMLSEIDELRAALTASETTAPIEPAPDDAEPSAEQPDAAANAVNEIAKRTDNCEVLIWALRTSLLAMARIHGEAMERHVQNEFNSVLAKADAIKRQQ